MDVDIVFDDGGSRFASYRNVIVQVRWGRLTAEALDFMLAHWRQRQRKAPSKMFAFFVITERAPLPEVEVRDKQREVVEELLESNRVEAALVIEGDGPLVETRRVLARLVSRRKGEIFPTVEAAADSIAKFADAPTEKEILEIVRATRSGIPGGG